MARWFDALQWYDEWTVIDDRAYRVNGDSWGWQPSYVYHDGEYWVPDASDDNDIETLIEDVRDDPHNAINLSQVTASDLERVGFEHCNGRFQHGWHPGQTDDPREILPRWQADYPTCEFVFIISDIGMFDESFHLFRRETARTCAHCGRTIVRDPRDRDAWVDPNASGDDEVWRETCDQHDTFTAEHEPAS